MRLCLACGSLIEPVTWTCEHCGHMPPEQAGVPLFAPDLAAGSSGFEAGLFAQLAPLEAGHFWFRARNRLIQWALKRYFPKAENLLEIGCGTGYVLSGLREAFPQLTLAGSEIFPEGLSFAAERLPGVDLWQMDARRLPFREAFDVIGAFDVIEHIREDESVLAEMYRAVKPGGGILLTVPQHAWLWSEADEKAHHVRRYSAADLRSKLKQAGFNVLRMTSFVSLLLPAMALSRLLSKPAAAKNTHAEPVRGENAGSCEGFLEASLADSPEFKTSPISPIVNATFEKMMGVERGLIQAGLSFPVGGSLLVAAVKR